MTNISDLTQKLNDLCKSLQESPKEEVSLENLIKAQVIIKYLKIDNIYDVLVFLAAMNICNTYIKKDKNKEHITYIFKNYIFNLLDAIKEKEIYNVYFYHTKSLLIVQTAKIQFSFHNISSKDNEQYFAEDLFYTKKLVFDNIRKQFCATTIFNTLLERIDFKNLLAHDGQKLTSVYKEVLDSIENKNIIIKDIL